MKKYILLAAVVAIAVPGGAQAQRHDQTRHNQRVVSQDRRTVRANRQVVRSDRRAARADRNLARHNRSVYVAPVRNWHYRPVNVGYRLQPAFYGSRYYISDYGTYNLQAPHNRNLRWVRYGNDLLLVNIRTGQVVQVVHYAGW